MLHYLKLDFQTDGDKYDIEHQSQHKTYIKLSYGN